MTGPRLGERLRLLRARIERWERWRTEHPETTVLSERTGHLRPYQRGGPYAGYEDSERLLFPVTLDRRYHPKTPTVGLRTRGGRARAYPADELRRAGGVAEERWGGGAVRVAWSEERGVFEVEAPDDVEVVEGFWFAWAAFHPETEVWTPPEAR